jgi:hypothetical protein
MMDGDRRESLPDPIAIADDAATLGAALALVAFALSGLAVGVLLLSEVWVQPAGGPWLIALACVAGSAVALVFLLRSIRPVWLMRGGDPGRMPGDVVPGRAHSFRGLMGRVAAAPLRAAATFLGLVVAAAAVAILHAIGDDHPLRNYWAVFGLWLLGIVLYVAGMVAPDRPSALRGAAAALRARRTAVSDATALLALALLLRVLWLTQVPSITTGDEGVFGLAARWMSQGEGSHMFGTYWANGMLYLVPHAWLLQLGVSPALAIRLPTAVFGALAAPATYAFGRTFGRRVGLLAGLWMATSHLHVHLSRMGLGHGLDALWAALAAWGLLGGMLRRDRRRAVLGGLALGAAQYGYVGGRAADAVALVFVLATAVLAFASWLWARGRGSAPKGDHGPPVRGEARRILERRLAPGPLLAALGASVVVAAPMIRWAVVRPGDYLSRLNATGLAQTGGLDAAIAESGGGAFARLLVAGRQAGSALLAFIGAPSDQFYFSDFPMLDVTWGALFLLGLILALLRPRDLRLSLPGWHVAVVLLLLGLSTHSATSAYRISGVLPAVAVLSAVVLWLLVEGALGPMGGRAHAAVVAVVALSVAGFQTWAYVGGFASGCTYFDINTARASILARDLAAAPSDTVAFVLGEPVFDPRVFDSVPFIAERRVLRLADMRVDDPQPGSSDAPSVIYSLPISEEIPDLVALLERAGDAPVRVYLIDERKAELQVVKQALPGGKLRLLRRCDDAAFELWQGSP